MDLLPDGYQEVLHWKVSEKPIRVIALQIFSIPLFFIFGLFFLSVAINLGKLPSHLEFGLGEVGSIVAGILLTLILHELTHGMMMRLFGASPRYGILWKQAMFYATTPGYAYPRQRYIFIALAPLFILSVLSVFGMVLWQGTFWIAVLGLCATVNASGAIGDIWMTIITLRYKATAYVMDEQDGIRVFMPNHGDENKQNHDG